ncbi:hypothetical protein ACH5RR_035329 [Cinchona calisaya]|uniref:Uncharacterized protein n=1 Tax=Cinchona calisaya TaxID=153742 RepID=A0ABD2YIW0_9GENT
MNMNWCLNSLRSIAIVLEEFISSFSYLFCSVCVEKSKFKRGSSSLTVPCLCLSAVFVYFRGKKSSRDLVGFLGDDMKLIWSNIDTGRVFCFCLYSFFSFFFGNNNWAVSANC